jgi:cathepsin B
MTKIVLALLAVVALVVADRAANDLQLIHEINTNPKSTWTAGYNSYFDGLTVNDVISRLGRPRLVSRYVSPRTNEVKEYDLRKAYPKCTWPITNEGQCGATWAIAGVLTMGERMCIKSQGKFNSQLSAEYVMACDTNNFGCSGGFLDKMADFLINHGTVTESCVPYTSQQGNVIPCPTSCTNSTEPFVLYKATSAKQFKLGEIAQIYETIYNRGPVEAGFVVWSDFIQYKSGVYQKSPKATQYGLHTARIVGWGVTEAGLKYWICSNQWGKFNCAN